MANRLEMAIHDAILQLHGLHWSRRRIARELGIDRATVARHLAHRKRQEVLSNAAKLPAGSESGVYMPMTQKPAWQRTETCVRLRPIQIRAMMTRQQILTPGCH
jgi:IS30 family transposase